MEKMRCCCLKFYPPGEMKFFLATKFGAFCMEESLKEKYGDAMGEPVYIRHAIERSLKRLGVSYVDLFYMHRMDPNTPLEKTIGTLGELVSEGKIKYIGLSECSGETLRKACAIHPIACVQVEYSPWAVEIETNGLLQAARELGVAIVAYSPLGRGFLTGKFRSIDDFEDNDWRKQHPRFAGGNFAINYNIVEEIGKIGTDLGYTPSQVVLAWILAQGKDFFIIPGTTNLSRLEENLKADCVTLSKESVDKIRNIINSIQIQGGRYDENSMKRCNI